MNCINFYWIQKSMYIQRSFLPPLKQWSSSLALNLIPISSVAIPEVQLLRITFNQKYFQSRSNYKEDA
nr:unnamed protein product [Callosobruchus analis]